MEGEEQWITEKSRYEPRKFEDGNAPDGSDDPVIKEMITLNQNPALRAAREKQQHTKE